MARNLVQPRFPAVRRILWDRTPVAPPHISLVTAQLPTLEVSNAILKELVQQLSSYDNTIAEPAATADEPPRTVVLSGQFEPRTRTLMITASTAESPIDPSSASISAVLHSDVSSDSLVPSAQYRSWMAQQIQTRLRTAVKEARPHECFEVRVDIAPSVSSDDSPRAVFIRVEVLFPWLNLVFTPLAPLPVHKSPLSEWLLKGEPILGSADFVFGYVTLDASRHVVPLLNTDPVLSSCPVVGIWLKPGANTIRLSQSWAAMPGSGYTDSVTVPALAQWCIRQPEVWASCVRFLHGCGGSGQTVTASPHTFLFVLYPPAEAPSPSNMQARVSGPAVLSPSFFECTCAPPLEDPALSLSPSVRSFRDDLTSITHWPGIVDGYAVLSSETTIHIGDIVTLSPSHSSTVTTSTSSVRFRFSARPDPRHDGDNSAPVPPSAHSQPPVDVTSRDPAATAAVDAVYDRFARTEAATAQSALVAFQQQQIVALQAKGMSYARAVLELSSGVSTPTPQPSQQTIIAPSTAVPVTHARKWIPDELYERWQRQWADTGSRSSTGIAEREVDLPVKIDSSGSDAAGPAAGDVFSDCLDSDDDIIDDGLDSESEQLPSDVGVQLPTVRPSSVPLPTIPTADARPLPRVIGTTEPSNKSDSDNDSVGSWTDNGDWVGEGGSLGSASLDDTSSMLAIEARYFKSRP